MGVGMESERNRTEVIRNIRGRDLLRKVDRALSAGAVTSLRVESDDGAVTLQLPVARGASGPAIDNSWSRLLGACASLSCRFHLTVSGGAPPSDAANSNGEEGEDGGAFRFSGD